MTPSPDPRSDRKRLGTDELVAVLVALISLGAIFFWSISQKDGGINLSLLQLAGESSPTTAAPSPQAIATPSVPPQATSSQVTVQPSIGLESEKPAIVVPSPSIVAPASSALPAPQAVPFIAAAPQPVTPPAPSPSAAPAASPSAPAAQPKQFTDVPPNFWASASIAALSAKGILDGFPDGTFQPSKPITRAEFAEIIRRAFNEPASREALKFNDLKSGYWASAAIDEATKTRFMSGFPNGSFQPNRQIPRLQVLLALATGLNLQPKLPANQVLSRYQDTEQIPKYAVTKIAAATEAGLVLKDGNPKRLNPEKVATRAEAAALVYEALKSR